MLALISRRSAACAFVLAGGIADLGGAAAHQHDRLVPACCSQCSIMICTRLPTCSDWRCSRSRYINIGGVSNITYIDGADTLIACDTGPGNALLDDFMFRVTGQPFDCEGRLAAQGKPIEAWIARALEHPFFALPPPKSLDRNDFASAGSARHAPADGAATLTAFTAAAIARIVPLLPKPPQSWIVAGGGARNLTMLRMLRERLRPPPSRPPTRWAGRRRDRGAGLRLSGGARPEGPAAQLSRHHGRADPDDRRRDRAAVDRKRFSERWRAACRDSRSPFPSAAAACRRRNGWRRG
jgi:hypothetical protein